MKVLTHTEFARICALLWGNRFVPAASKALKRGTRSIERYCSDKANIPPDVRRRLVTEAAKRSEELGEVVSAYTV